MVEHWHRGSAGNSATLYRLRLSTGQSQRGTDRKPVSAVPAHVVPPDCVNQKYQARSFMEKARIERTFSIGDALAMRPLRPMPAGIWLPLAELILGKGISPVATGDQGLCKVSSANLWTPQFFEKN